MIARTDEPAVLTWQLVMAPRPKAEPIGHHWWRDLVYDTWFWQTNAWSLAREAACNGWATEESEWEAEHPRPRLGDAMQQLSSGSLDMYELNLERLSRAG